MISKLKALLDLKVDVGLNKADKVLYLGASHGVTAIMISGMVGEDGFVFCLDISPTVMKELLVVCEKHENMAPLLYDANKIEEFESKVPQVDFIYQDLAQRNQVDIFKKNAERFLKANGRFILIIKARSIDVVKPAKEVLEEVKKGLDGYEVKVLDIDKTHKGHYALIGKKT